MKSVLIVAVAAAAAAWGADYVVEGGVHAGVVTPESAAPDATIELKWDSGKWGNGFCWWTGWQRYVGNDFDISLFPAYRTVKTGRLYSTPRWPNERWDGFRMYLYSLSGGRPASVIWGPFFYIGSGYGFTWCDIPIGYVLPPGQDEFVAVMEQVYYFPYCDPFFADDNTGDMGHSWAKKRGYSWDWFKNFFGMSYPNLMLRVVMESSGVSIRPTSLGRVKALFK
jgi:hypothetical protein